MSTDITTIQDGVTSDQHALIITTDLAFSEWKRLGDRLASTVNRGQWSLGDWRLYGQRYTIDHPDGLRAIDQADETLRVYAWVCQAFPPDRRERTASKLSFGHHQIVAGLTENEADRWLDTAITAGLSKHRLHAEIRDSRALTAPKLLDVTRITWQIETGRHARYEAAATKAGMSLDAWALETLDRAAA